MDECKPLVMGNHIWSGSADHFVYAWDIKTKAPLYALGDLGGYVRGSIRVGWALWVGPHTSALFEYCPVPTQEPGN